MPIFKCLYDELRDIEDSVKKEYCEELESSDIGPEYIIGNEQRHAIVQFKHKSNIIYAMLSEEYIQGIYTSIRQVAERYSSLSPTQRFRMRWASGVDGILLRDLYRLVGNTHIIERAGSIDEKISDIRAVDSGDE